MKTFPIAFLIAFAGLAAADKTFETAYGCSTITHEKSPLPARTRQLLMDGREPTPGEQAAGSIFLSYVLGWTATLHDPRPEGETSRSGMLTLRVWDRGAKRFPGSNRLIVEIFSDTVRLSCQELAEVPWALDVWTTSHRTASYLYVQTRNRHRLAEGTVLYELNPKTLKLEHKGVHFSKGELARENKEMREIAARMGKAEGKEDAAENDGEAKAEKAVPAGDEKPVK